MTQFYNVQTRKWEEGEEESHFNNGDWVSPNGLIYFRLSEVQNTEEGVKASLTCASRGEFYSNQMLYSESGKPLYQKVRLPYFIGEKVSSGIRSYTIIETDLRSGLIRVEFDGVQSLWEDPLTFRKVSF